MFFLASVAVFVSFSPQIRTALSSSDAAAIERKAELKEGMCVKPGR